MEKKPYFYASDVEGKVVMDREVSTTISESNGATIRRKLMKIEDETGTINITVWNKKVNYYLTIKEIFLR